MYKVRFHLGAGPNFMNWQIKGPNNVWYADPKTESLFISDCTLNNNKKIAHKINGGAHKSVCAWVTCGDVLIVKPYEFSGYEDHDSVNFNPRKCTHWVNSVGENIDGKKFEYIFSRGNKLFVPVGVDVAV